MRDELTSHQRLAIEGVLREAGVEFTAEPGSLCAYDAPNEPRARRMAPEQCREARRLLGWNCQRLGARAGVSWATVYAFERSASRTKPGNLIAIRAALESAGAEFTDGDAPGVRLRKGAG